MYTQKNMTFHPIIRVHIITGWTKDWSKITFIFHPPPQTSTKEVIYYPSIWHEVCLFWLHHLSVFWILRISPSFSFKDLVHIFPQHSVIHLHDRKNIVSKLRSEYILNLLTSRQYFFPSFFELKCQGDILKAPFRFKISDDPTVLQWMLIDSWIICI